MPNQLTRSNFKLLFAWAATFFFLLFSNLGRQSEARHRNPARDHDLRDELARRTDTSIAAKVPRTIHWMREFNVMEGPTMPRHRTNTRSVELLQRSGEIKQLRASLSVRADKPRSLPPERVTMLTIDIVGELTAPLAGTSAFSLMAYVTPNPTIGRAQPPSIGAITATKPTLQGAIDLSPSEFQSLLTMASGGLLKYCYLVTTKPRYRSALIVSIDFSTRPPAPLDE